MSEQYKNISQLSEMTGFDRATIRKRLSSVKPYKQEAKLTLYDCVVALPAIFEVQSEEENKKAMLEAELKHEQAKAEKAHLELDKLKKEVVPIEDVSKHWAEIAVKVKNKILGVSSKIKQRHPEISLEVFATLEANHREALEELANESDTEMHRGV